MSIIKYKKYNIFYINKLTSMLIDPYFLNAKRLATFLIMTISTSSQSTPIQSVGKETAELTFAPVRQRALRESVFEALLLAIVRGEMKPGTWSNHQRLAQYLRVSVTPLREALLDLAACGIVENQYNRGTVVRPFGPPQLLEMFHVRGLLESEAARLACPLIEHADLIKLQSQTEELIANESLPDWNSKVIANDDRFHTLIANSCGNLRLKEEIFRYRSLLLCIRRAIVDHHYPFALAMTEHLAVIKALLRQRPEEAADAMKRHILSAAKVDTSLLFPEIKTKN